MVEPCDFVKFLEDMDPKFKSPNRYQITEKYLPYLMKQVAAELKKRLQVTSRVLLTVDIWTDTTHAYLGLTAHTFVDCAPKSFLWHFKHSRVHKQV